MRQGAQPFLQKWVLFAWEWKMISISKAEHLPSFWTEAPRNSEMAYSYSFLDNRVACCHRNVRTNYIISFNLFRYFKLSLIFSKIAIYLFIHCLSLLSKDEQLAVRNMQYWWPIYPNDLGIYPLIIHWNKFPRFWLARSTRLIHHNQLLMTKFVFSEEMASNAPVSETWGRGWVALIVNLKNGGHFTRFKSITSRKNS